MSTQPMPPVQKRTNVRPSVQAVRAAIHAVEPASRPLAARMAGELFLRPRRHGAPRWERELLGRARSFRVPFGDAHLPAWEWGPAEGTPVLLAHGWEGRGSQLGAFVFPLLARGFRVVAFDGPGHGRAPSHRSSVVHLALGIERMATVLGPLAGVVAHSVGGAATALALRVSRGNLGLGRCVIVAPPISPERFFGLFTDTLALGPELDIPDYQILIGLLGFDVWRCRSQLGGRRRPDLIAACHDQECHEHRRRKQNSRDLH